MENNNELSAIEEELSAVRKELKTVLKGLRSVHNTMLITGLWVLLIALQMSPSRTTTFGIIGVFLIFSGILLYSLFYPIIAKKRNGK